MKKIISLLIVLLIIASSICLSVVADSAGSALNGDDLLTSLGVTATGHGYGIDYAESVTRDADGRLVVKAPNDNRVWLYISADLSDEAKALTSYRIEAEIMGVDIAAGYRYGITLNTEKMGTSDHINKSTLTYKSGTKGQVICKTSTKSWGGASLGTENTNFSQMSSELNVENILSMNYNASTKKVTYYVNSVKLTDLEETSESFPLTSFSVAIPFNSTVAISYMRVYDGNGALVYDNTFTNQYEKNEETLSSYGMSVGKYVVGEPAVDYVGRDASNRLVIKSFPSVRGETYVSANLNEAAKGLESYTVEAKVTGVNVFKNYQYGISLNTDVVSKKASYFMYCSEGGQMKCFSSTKNNQGNVIGAADTAFEDMSSALGVENVLSMTYDASTKKVTYRINDVLVCDLEEVNTDFSLSTFNVMISSNQTIAVSYMRVYDIDGNLVYDNTFSEGVKHNLTVNYIYPNGEKATESVVQALAHGDRYSIESPVIAGFTPNYTTVSGQMGTQDKTIDVIYAGDYTLTIHYVDDLGNKVMDDYVAVLKSGTSYSINSLGIANHTADKAKVEGVMGYSDVEITVTYTARNYRLIIKYQYADGTTAYADYVESFRFGSNYEVDSPIISGFEADKKIVSANKISKDVEVIVVYTAVAGTVDTTDATETTDVAETTDSKSVFNQGCGSTIGMFTLIPILLGGALIGYRKKGD